MGHTEFLFHKEHNSFFFFFLYIQIHTFSQLFFVFLFFLQIPSPISHVSCSGFQLSCFLLLGLCPCFPSTCLWNKMITPYVARCCSHSGLSCFSVLIAVLWHLLLLLQNNLQEESVGCFSKQKMVIIVHDSVASEMCFQRANLSMQHLFFFFVELFIYSSIYLYDDFLCVLFLLLFV